MSEELETPAVDPVQAAKEALAAEVPNPDLQPESEYTEAEIEAMEHGWNPEGVEGKRTLTAEEFLDRQPLYDEQKRLKKEIRELKKGMSAVLEMQEQVRERDRAALIAELNAQKINALENDDYDRVIAIDDQIAEERATAKANPPNNAAFESWVEDNEWYHQDTEMKKYADTIGAGYYQNNPDTPMEDIYEFVAKEVKARFPEKFGNVNRSKPTPVEGARRGRAGAKSKHTARDLSEDERRVMRTILRASDKLTEAEYLKQYFDQ